MQVVQNSPARHWVLDWLFQYISCLNFSIYFVWVRVWEQQLKVNMCSLRTN